MPAGSLLSAAHCHGFRRIRTNENSAVYMRARRDRASICPCMAQTSRANYYNSIESPLYYYGFVTNPHLAHHFIHIIPTRTVHKLSVNRLCRQGSKRRLPSDFFRQQIFHFPAFLKSISLRTGTKTLFHIIHNCLCGQSSTFSSCDENYSRRTLFMLTALLSSEPHGFLFQNMSHTSKDRQVAILISLFVFFAEMTKRMN